MKRFVLAAALGLGLFALTARGGSASGFGNGGTYGISPGSISFGVGFNLAWSGVSVGQMNGGGCQQAPCYGPPAMYNGYGNGYGGDYGYGYGYGGDYGYGGYYG